MMTMLRHGIAGGAFIAIGAGSYLAIPNPVIGSFVFSLGLLGICMLRLKLYTGLAGYFFVDDIANSLIPVLVYNCVGATLTATLIACTNPAFGETANRLWEAKMNLPFAGRFASAIMCGALMFIAVHTFNHALCCNQCGKVVCVILPVMTFILCGFEHCIADMAYAAFSKHMTLDDYTFIAWMAIGNLLGGILTWMLTLRRE